MYPLERTTGFFTRNTGDGKGRGRKKSRVREVRREGTKNGQDPLNKLPVNKHCGELHITKSTKTGNSNFYFGPLYNSKIYIFTI